MCDADTLLASSQHGRSHARAPCSVVCLTHNFALRHRRAPPCSSSYLLTRDCPALSWGIQTTFIFPIIGRISIGHTSIGLNFKGTGRISKLLASNVRVMPRTFQIHYWPSSSHKQIGYGPNKLRTRDVADPIRVEIPRVSSVLNSSPHRTP